MNRGPFHVFACHQDMFARKEYRNVESEEEAARWVGMMKGTMPDARYVTDTEWQQILRNERFPRPGELAREPKVLTPAQAPVILSAVLTAAVSARKPPEHAYSTRDVIDEVRRRHPAAFDGTDPVADHSLCAHLATWTDWALAARLALTLEQIKRKL